VLVPAVLVAVKVLAQAWCFAPYNYDALSYHLPKVAEWVRAGGFTREMGLDSHASFPAGFELIEAWWTVFLHHDALIELAGAEFLLLLAAAAYGLGRHLGLDGRSAGYGALTATLVPGLQIQATGGLNDLPAAATALATLLLLVEGAPWALVLAACGLGFGIKPTFAYLIPGLLLLVRRGARLPRAGELALAAAGAVAGGFWLVRNALWYGNPVHPVGPGGLSDTMGKIQAGANLDSLLDSVRDLVDARLYDAHEPMGPLLTGSAGWGAAVIACGLPGLVLAMKEDPRVRRLALALLLSALSVLLFTRHDPWNLRFILVVPAALSIFAARFAAAQPAARPVLALALAFCFVSTLLPSELRPASAKVLWDQGVGARSMAPELFGEPPSDPAIGIFADVRRKTYPLYGPGYDRRLLYLRSATAADLVAEMDREGVRTVYAFPHHPEGKAVLEDCVRSGRLIPLRGQFYRREGGP
jgi:hypothetical protein